MGPFLGKSFFVLLVLAAGLISIIRAQYTNRSGKQGEQVTSTLNSLLNGYDKRVRPNFGVHPVDVGITMYVLSVESFNEAQMEFTMSFYFRQRWRDPRLKYTGYPYNIAVAGNELSDKLWTPDSFFVNQKTKVIDDSFTRLHVDGDVLRAVRVQLTASCPLNLRFFPLDTQTCSIEIESFSSSMVDIKYNWASGTESIGMSPDVSLPQWKVYGYRPRALEISLATGNYSRLTTDIQFTRSIGYYIVSLYIPAAILVLLSWIPFWMSTDAMTARVLTGVASAIVLLQIWQKSVVSLPKISYLKASDIYFIACIAMIFLTLIEHALITCLITRRKQFKKNMQNDISRGGSRRTPCCLRAAPLLLDWLFRLAFPVLFAGFNVLYWKYLLSATSTSNLNMDNFIPVLKYN